MASILSFLGNQIRGAAAQANPWDGGATYASVTRKREEEERRRQAQAQQRQTLNRQPQGLMQPPTLLNQQTYQQTRQLFQQVANNQLSQNVQDRDNYYGSEANVLKQELAKGDKADPSRLAGLAQSLKNRQKELSDGTFAQSVAYDNMRRIEPIVSQGLSFDDMAKKSGASTSDVANYMKQYHRGYGDKGIVKNTANTAGQFAKAIVTTPVKAVSKVPNNLFDRNNQDVSLRNINDQFQTGVISGNRAMELADQEAARGIGRRVEYNPENGRVEFRNANPLEFAGEFTQAGVDVAGSLPIVGGVASGASRFATGGTKRLLENLAAKATVGAQTQATSRLADTMIRNGVSPNVANLVGNAVTSNAKQAAMYGTAQTTSDVLNGRGITPESIAMNYGADFLMGSIPEITLGGAGIIARNGIDLHNSLTPSQRQGGFIAGPLAGDFKKAQAAGRVFEGVDGKPRFEVSDENMRIKNPEGKTLGEMIDHPELFRNYPGLAEIKIGDSLKGGEVGHYDPSTNTINARDISDLNTILHELQHSIQTKEDFALGGDPSQLGDPEKAKLIDREFEKYKEKNPRASKVDFILDNRAYLDQTYYKNLAGEAEARAVAARRKMTDAERYVPGKTADEYAMSHRPDADGATLDDISRDGEFVPQDVYSNPEWYGDISDTATRESVDLIKKVRGNPEAEVTVYRAAPKNELNSGDWISLSKKYAQGESAVEGTKVHSFKVKAKDLRWPGDSFNEFGYFPENNVRSTFYDSLDVPKEDLIIRNDTQKALSVQQIRNHPAILELDRTIAQREATIKQHLDNGMAKGNNTIKNLEKSIKSLINQQDKIARNLSKQGVMMSVDSSTPAPKVPEVDLKNLARENPSLPTSELVRRLNDASDASRRGTPSEISAQPKPKSPMPQKQSARKKSPKPEVSPLVADPTKSRGSQQSQTGQSPDIQNSDRSSTNNATKEDVQQYVDGQVKAQQAETKVPLKQKIADFMAVSKHTLVDDAVAHERYIKDKRTKAELREGVDRVRGSSMIARQFAEDNGMNMLGKMKTEDLNEFQQYLIAKRSMELKERNIATGRSHQMDMALIKQVGKKYATQEKMIRDYAKSMLDYSVENGLISKELRDNLLETSKSYVPMNRVMDTVEGSGVHKSRQLGSLSKQTVVQKLKGSERIVQNPIESLLLNTERMVNEAQRNNVASRIAGIDTIAERVLKDGDTVRPGYDTLSYLDNGKNVRVEVPALVAKEMRNLNSVLPDWATTTMKVVGFPTQMLRTGATSANPIFAISNLVRDQLQTAITGSVRANIKGTPKAMVATFSPRKGGQKLRAELRRNGIIGSEYRQTYGFKSGELMGELQANNQLPKVAWERMRHPIDALADIIGTTENFTRAQQFYGTEGDMTTRAQAARNNTLNFGRAGVLTRQLNRVIPFLNAGVQGGRITAKSFKERPYRTTAAFATFAGVALAAKAMNNSINDELFDRVSDEEKKQNIIWFMPGAKYNPEENRVDGLIKIPMPQMLYPVLDAVNNVEGKPEDLMVLASNVFTALTGIEAGGLETINQLTPTAIKPAVEAGLNKNLYSGQDLISEHEKNEAPEDKGAKYTSGVARKIASITNIDAPVVDSTIGNWGGGLAKDLSKSLSDNPDNSKDNRNMLTEGFHRRFGSSAVTSQYDIQASLAKEYKKQLESSDSFKSMSREDQVKTLNKVDADTKAIAGIMAKTEQGRGDEIKRDLTGRQKNLVENGFNADTYLKDVETGANNGVKIASGISADSVKTLEQYNSLSSDDRKALFTKENDAEFKYNLAKYENDLASGTLSTAQRIKAEKSLAKDKIGSVFPKEVRDLYSLSKADLADYLTTEEKGVDKKKLYDQLVAYDQALNDNGLASSLKFKYGLGSGRKSGGRKSGGRKGSGSKYSTSQLAQAAALRYSLALAKPKVAGGTAMPKGGTRAVGAIARANLKKSRPTSELVKLATVKVGRKVKR